MLIRIVGPFAFAYFLSYLFRVINAVAGPGLVADIGVDAASLGLLTSTYFIAFAATQIPLGVALDRYGPRTVEAALMAVAALGALVFATADSLMMLVIGRGLIGFGVSAALMGAFKAFAMMFERDRLPTLNGVHLAAGALGALAGGTPSDMMMQAYGWRDLFLLLAALSLISAVLIAVLGPSRRGPPAEGTLGEQIRAAGGLFIDPLFVRVALFLVASQGSMFAMHGLWAGPWLRDVQGLSTGAAATVLSAMAIAMMAGFLSIGTLATRLARRSIDTLYVAIAGMALFMIPQIGLVFLPPGFGPINWCVYAFFGSAAVLLYPAMTARYPDHLGGRVITALNFALFVGSFVIQWLVGIAIDALAEPLGLKATYDAVFLVMIGFQIAGLTPLLMRPLRAGAR